MLDISLFDGFNAGCEGVGWYWNQKKVSIFWESQYPDIEGIGMYGAEQQILEEEIKTELECQTESLTVWAQVCLSAGTGDSHSHSMQNMIENFLFIIWWPN